MEWTAVTVETSNEAVDAVSNILTESGANGIQIDNAADFQGIVAGRFGKHGEIVDPAELPHRQTGAAVTGYFPPKALTADLLAQIKQRVLQLKKFGLNPAPARVSADGIKDEEWSTV